MDIQTDIPSLKPSTAPTARPTRAPSVQPSNPTRSPTIQPSRPTATPTSSKPTALPTAKPSASPSFGMPSRAPIASGVTEVFNFTGEAQLFTVPAGVTSLYVTLYGAQGSSVATTYDVGGAGGYGAVISANVPVTPGEVYAIYVGGGGVTGPGGGGWNGGGSGKGTATSTTSGGGATDFRASPYSLADRLLVAGGGGGADANCRQPGGGGGFPDGLQALLNCGPYAKPGPGTQTHGGAYADNSNSPLYCTSSSTGSLGQAGEACGTSNFGYGAGGGGGYYGAGGSFGSGGSGGSSHSVYPIVQVFNGSSVVSTSGHGYATVVYVNSLASTMYPSPLPTRSPSLIPSLVPTVVPSAVPSAVPSLIPSISPSVGSSQSPSVVPSAVPSTAPSTAPTISPSVTPSVVSSAVPSAAPSLTPTTLPTYSPSAVPSASPSVPPSVLPSVSPSASPSLRPSVQPTAKPTPNPNVFAVPVTAGPSVRPSASPSTSKPTASPTTSKPTATPSFRPTARPSTGAPTLYWKASTVTKTESTFTSGTITLDVTFAPAATYPGQIYCIALVNNGVVVSTDQVVAGGTAVSYLIDAVSARVVLQGLSALTPYATYCYLETAQGVGNSLLEVQATRALITTACCKALTLTNSPTSLYIDSSKYPADQTARYVFSYSLGNAPFGVLDVTPNFALLTGVMGPTRAITVSPATTRFLASSITLTGSFIISTSSAFFQTGDYNLTLQLSGTSSAEYRSPATVKVQVLSTSVPPSPPALLSAVFSSDGSALVVTLDSASDQILSSVPCASLFSFNGASKATCTWTSNSAVRVKFPAYDGTAFAEPNQILQLKANTIKAQCYAGADCSAYAFSSAQSVTIAAPASPINPTVVISMPRLAVSCANVTVDASLSTGHGGRPWQVASWTVRANVPGTSTAALEAKLNSIGTTLAQSTRFMVLQYAAQGVEYTISLSVTNFLGKSSSASAVFSISGNPNVPIVQILGDTAVTVTPMSSVTIFASSGKSICAEKSVKFSSFWTIYSSDNSIVNVQSTSANPNVLMLPAYSLSASSRYRAVMTTSVTASETSDAVSASAEAYITVSSGNVVAVISGGDSRLVLPVSVITIDASSSYDENVPRSSASQLTFLWSCTYLTTSRYGTDCSDVFVTGTMQSARVSITGTALNAADTYSFKVQVTASTDTRSASKAITLRVQNVASSTSVAITTAPAKINANQRLSLTGRLSADYELTGVWTATNAGSSVSFVASTPVSAVFTAATVAAGTDFALLVPASQLSEGSTVTFRLTADRVGFAGTIYQSYSEVSVMVNAPPTSGSFAVTPSTGEALVTSFDLAASGWTDDTTDLPLSYMFQFMADPQSGTLVIQSRQSASSVSALLPAGSESLHYAVTLTATIYDNLLAATSSTSMVNVTSVTSTEALASYLADSLNVFQATQDTSQATLMVNNIATTINVVNCSAANATFCSALNRQPCSTEPGTCSSCLSGYVGVVGNSNAKCVLSANSNGRYLLSSVGGVGDSCASNDQCQLGSCENGICIVPTKLCPSTVPNTVCSGNGECVYSDNTGETLASACTIFDTQCFATCACTNGTAGYDCSVTPERLQGLDTMRRTMCETFLAVAALSNPSAELLETSVVTLLAAFDINQAITNDTVSACTQALQIVSALAAADGILAEATTETVSALVQLAGRFVRTANVSLGWDGAVLDASMANITSGVLQSMVNGQTDVSVASTTIKFIATKAKVSDLSVLVAPLTAEEQAYGVTSTAVLELADGASAACDAGKGYVDVALTQWGINPFPGVNGQLKAPQIKFESSVSVTSESNRLRTLQIAEPDPAYYVTLVYNQPQNVTRDLPLTAINATFPECTVYNADTQRYTSCGDCVVSTYNNNNVTFVCYDITHLCGSGGVESATRRLADQLLQHRGSEHSEILASNDDADGWGAQTSITSIQYSALVSSFTNVLSTNIFRVNWRAAKATVAVVVMLIGILIIGVFYFRAWDVHDHDLFLYKYKELPHQRLKKIDKARSIKLKAPDDPPQSAASGFSFSKGISLPLAKPRHASKFASQPSAAIEIYEDAPEPSHAQSANSMDFVNPMKRAVSFDPVHETIDNEQDVATMEATVDGFIRSAIPIRNLDGTPTDKLTTALDILTKHPLFNLFFEANLQVSRVQRFIQICIETLCGLFVDTLFFSTFYPTDGECESYTTETDCLVPQNSAVGNNMCFWSPNVNIAQGGTCRPEAPPSDVMFMMILVMITLVITVPLSFVFDYVITEYCSKRPDFDEWGYNTESLLGRSTQSLGEFATEKLVSPIVALRQEVERSRAQLRSPVRFHSAGYLSTPRAANERDQKHQADAETEGRAVYHELIGVQEEVDEILRDAVNYLTITVRNQNVPWKTSVLHGSTAASALLLNRQKVRAIEDELGVRSDGTPMQMSLYDYLVYGTQTNKLLAKIKKVRRKATLIRKTLDELGESELLSKDEALTQFFILEQFSVFKQYALRSALFRFSVTSALPINPWYWILGWMFVIGALVFFVYWILAWGISTADVTIETWGVNFAIGTVQELVLIQTFRLYVIYVISNIFIKPQLTAIYRTLQRLAIEYVQDEQPDGFGAIKVVQHVSPACRIARLRISDGLAAGQILRQIDDSDVHNFRHASNLKLPVLLFTVVAIPVIAGLLNDATGDITFNSVLPSAFSMLILGHVLLWRISPVAVILPYVALILFLLFGGLVFGKAEKRMQKMTAQSEMRVGMKTLAGWQKRYRTTFNARMTYVECFVLYMRTNVGGYWNFVVDGLARFVYYTRHRGELGTIIVNFIWPVRVESLNEKAWQKINMPDFLHGRVIAVNGRALNVDTLSAERIELPELPERILRMAADVPALWAAQGTRAAPRPFSGQHCSRGSQRYVLNLLSGEEWKLLAPAPMAPEVENVLEGDMVEVVPHMREHTLGPVAVRFKEKYGFHSTLEAAICKVLKSFQSQLCKGSIYFLSLEDEQQLIAAVATHGESESPSSLLQYSGRVHVRDAALMLEEILYFYRPDGEALSTATVKTVLSRYDEWISSATEPLDVELLTAAGHLLNVHDENGFYSSSAERGHFQQHQLVSVMHFDNLAKELKPSSPAVSPRGTSNAQPARISCTWSDIRIVLDNETKFLREAETGIMSAALRSLSGEQRLSLASRMEAKKRQEEEKVHIAHATVAFDAFVAFLNSVLQSDSTLSRKMTD